MPSFGLQMPSFTFETCRTIERQSTSSSRSAPSSTLKPTSEEILVEDAQQHLRLVGDELGVSHVVLLAQANVGRSRLATGRG